MEDDKHVEQIEAGFGDTADVLPDSPNSDRVKRPRQWILEVTDQTTVSTSNGKFPRTILHDGQESYILAQELLSAIGAPIKCQADVDQILQSCLTAHAKVTAQEAPPLIKRHCKLQSGMNLCAILDRYQVEQIYQAMETPIQQDIFTFLHGLWNNHDQNVDLEIANQCQY